MKLLLSSAKNYTLSVCLVVEEREAVIGLVILNTVFVGVHIRTVKSLPNQLR